MTDVKQILQSKASAYMQAVDSAVNAMRVCLPGSIVAFNANTQTATIRPCITGTLGGQESELPLLLDVPVFFPGGSSLALTFNVNAGDDCIVVFADSCIDSWFMRGDVQRPFFDRHHDLSDGFALVGFRPKPRAVDMDSKPFAVRMLIDGEWKTPLWIDNNGIVHAETGGE